MNMHDPIFEPCEFCMHRIVQKDVARDGITVLIEICELGREDFPKAGPRCAAYIEPRRAHSDGGGE